MQTTLVLDASNRIVLSRELRRAAGIPRLQKLKVSATPGRIILEMEENSSGRVVKRGKLKVWTGSVPPAPIEAAVDRLRNRHSPSAKPGRDGRGYLRFPARDLRPAEKGHPDRYAQPGALPTRGARHGDSNALIRTAFRFASLWELPW